MHQLAIYLLTMKFYAHRAHHETSGPSFFSDHAAFGDAYEAYKSAYDSILERMIGLRESCDEIKIVQQAAADFARLSDMWWSELLSLEVGLRKCLQACNSKASLGTQNLLAQLADDSEVRTYKFKQRRG